MDTIALFYKHLVRTQYQPVSSPLIYTPKNPPIIIHPITPAQITVCNFWIFIVISPLIPLNRTIPQLVHRFLTFNENSKLLIIDEVKDYYAFNKEFIEGNGVVKSEFK
ncbi:hypothetical protein ACIGC1_18780 [Peribacillus butanolivorans]|uniref:hypothetical protein n=1 Tax=Peribacillus butanolivorans TaxID=421767 RepID=UPI0037CB3F72